MDVSVFSDKSLSDVALGIFEVCSATDFPMPEGTVSAAADVTAIIYTNLRSCSASNLGISEETNFNDKDVIIKTEFLLRKTKEWIVCGHNIINDAGFNKIDSWPDVFYLEAFVSENINDEFVFHNSDLTYDLLCLHHLSEFALYQQQSCSNIEDFDVPEKAARLYKATIDGMGSLMCAQAAAELARVHTKELSGHAKLMDERSRFDELAPNALINKEKMEDYNRSKQQKAIDYWVPLIREVIEVKNRRGITNNSAACIVANKHGTNHGTLYNNISKYKKFT
ncbi:MAG: hypothetical protein V7739_04750 [Motiliproteus sp.]